MDVVYRQVPKERYELLMARYHKYIEALNDPDKEPVRVFEPLSEKALAELEMIREISRELQAKKEEDMRKAAAAASEAEEAAKKAAEEEKQKAKNSEEEKNSEEQKISEEHKNSEEVEEKKE